MDMDMDMDTSLEEQREGIQSCIDHTTTDEFDFSAEELRLVCQNYYDEYDAVTIMLPYNIDSDKAFSYTTPSVIHHNCLPPPRKRYRVFGMTIKEIMPQSLCYTGHHHRHHNLHDNVHVHANHHHDIINIDHDDEKEKDGVDDSSVIASSVGSNDYVSDVSISMYDDDDDVSTSSDGDKIMSRRQYNVVA